MTVIKIFAVPVLMAGLLCCGEKAPTEKSEADGHEGHEHAMTEGDSHEDIKQPPRRPKKIPPAVMDSLRLKKQRYNITEDSYWDDKGGILGNSFVEVHYPPGPTTVTHGMFALEQIVFAREKCRAYWGEVPGEKLKIISPLEMEEFEKLSGREWWHYSRIEGDQITLQPIYILFQRQLGEIAIAHEYHEWAIGKLSKDKAPRLLTEGLASHLSEEKTVLQQQIAKLADEDKKMTPDEIEKTLQKESKMEPSRLAYYHAHRLVTGIIHYHGDESLKLVMKRLGEGVHLDSAFMEACDKSYPDVLAQVADYKGGE
jgi:hypothetical protein